MFNWFDKLLVKIAKKILNKYAPHGEFIAYINEREEKVLKDLGGYGQPINETGVKSFIPEWMKDLAEQYTKYKPLVDTGIGLGKAYLDYKSQKELNELSEEAYNQYMRDKQAAAQEAQAAVDLNLTPMEITNVPTTKADVSDFTAVAARGGLMNLPTRQRKRYASQGFVEDDEIEIMEPESLGDFELQKEEGVNIGEQVFHDTGDDRTNAQQVWQSGQIDQGLYEMDFEIFFNSRDWEDHISRGTAQGDMQMAKGNFSLDEYPEKPFNNPPYQPTQGEQDAAIQHLMTAASGGIAGLRHGGRPGYQFGIGPQQGMMPQGMMPQQGLRPGYAEQGFVNPQTFMTEEEASTGNPGNKELYSDEIMAKPDGGLEMIQITEPEAPIRIKNEEGIDVVLMGNDATEFNQLKDTFIKMGLDEKEAEKRALKLINQEFEIKFKKGGRIGYAGGSDLRAKLMEHYLDEGYSKKEAERIVNEKLNSYKDLGITGAFAQGGRIKKDNGGIMNLGGMEKDYRTTGGFVPIGAYERKDDVPARLSKNEFVMTADAVRAAGGGSINRGAQRMYDTMKHLEASPTAKRMTA